MADLINRMATLSMGDGNVNEKGEFLVKGGPRNGPIVWNPTTAYIESWNQLPLHPVNSLKIIIYTGCTLKLHIFSCKKV